MANGNFKVNMLEKPVLYVWVRKLPSMNPGKALAHSGHAASHMFYMCQGTPLFKKWVDEGCGFGTQINLDHGDRWPKDVFAKLNTFDYKCGYVVDPTYPFLVDKEVAELLNPTRVVMNEFVGNQMLCTREEETAFWAFVDANDPEIKAIIDQFSLAP